MDMPLAGATPFFIAAKGADVGVMRLLVAHGADPLTTDGKATPLMAAAGVGYRQARVSEPNARRSKPSCWPSRREATSTPPT